MVKNILIIDDNYVQFKEVNEALFKVKIENNIFFPPHEYTCYPKEHEAESFCTTINSLAKEEKLNDLYLFIFKYIEKNEIVAIFSDRNFSKKDTEYSHTGDRLLGKIKNNEIHMYLKVVMYSKEKAETGGTLNEVYNHYEKYVCIGSAGNPEVIAYKFLKELRDGKQEAGELFRSNINEFNNRKYKYNLAIICALKIEYNEVIKLLENQEVAKHDVQCKDKEVKCGYMINTEEGIIIKVLIRYLKDENFYGSYGYTQMLKSTQDVIDECKPEYVTTTGVMAGYKKDNGVCLGNVMLPEKVFIPDGERGQKEPIPRGDIFDSHVNNLYNRHERNNILYNATEAYLITIENRDEILKLINTTTEEDRQKIHTESKIATVLNKVEDQEKFDGIVEQQVGTKGLEMEIYGLYEAARDKSAKAIAFKTVVDYGDQNTNKKWQNIGSYLSAYVMHTFFMEIIFPSKQKKLT